MNAEDVENRNTSDNSWDFFLCDHEWTDTCICGDPERKGETCLVECVRCGMKSYE